MDNKKRRELARARGLDTYTHEVVEGWPGCVDCGYPIRGNVSTNRIGLWRACGCPGVMWENNIRNGGWEKHRSRTDRTDRNG